MYYGWSKESEAGKRRLAGDTARAATSDEVKDLPRGASLEGGRGRSHPRNRLLKKHDRGWGRRGMRYSASDKIEIHPAGRAIAWAARRALEKLGIPRSSFYRWYDRYQGGGPEALADRPSRPDRVWNRIPEAIRSQIARLSAGSTRAQLRGNAVRFTDEAEYFVSEASVYRLLKAHDLITSSGLHRHQSGRGIQGQDHGAQPALANRLHLSQDHGMGWYYLDRAGRLLALHYRLESSARR